MKQHVTVIPSDDLIAVAGVPLWFGFVAPANLHALQWHDGAGEMEWTDDLNHPLTTQDYDADVAPFVTLWEAEKARLDAEANRPPTLEQAKAAKISEIRVAFAVAEAGGYIASSLGFRADATRRSIEDIEGLIDLVVSGVLTIWPPEPRRGTLPVGALKRWPSPAWGWGQDASSLPLRQKLCSKASMTACSRSHFPRACGRRWSDPGNINR